MNLPHPMRRDLALERSNSAQRRQTHSCTTSESAKEAPSSAPKICSTDNIRQCAPGTSTYVFGTFVGPDPRPGQARPRHPTTPWYRDCDWSRVRRETRSGSGIGAVKSGFCTEFHTGPHPRLALNPNKNRGGTFLRALEISPTPLDPHICSRYVHPSQEVTPYYALVVELVDTLS